MNKTLLFLFSTVLLVGCKSETKTKEEKFWNWVSENKVELENFINSNHEDYTIYNQLTSEMKKYNSVLFPEMTLTEKNEVVLIITPDGMSEGILPTEKLYDSKPKLDNWIIKKFRQASDETKLNYDGIEYPSSDIKIIPRLDKEQGKVNIQVYIRNMNSDVKKHQALSFLYLDHILGEYNTITKVGYIDFYHLEMDKNVENGISILELRKLIEKEFKTTER
ncbi:hypothetical protein [Aquimarina algicola]|uniref:Uncharacterized protein n=1 Tax=Aquimarina algicola TaxID=2589995 RepID=A0A504JGF1_9FLAO|nr:hypothetical protein [Aquimarina algicola]TPN86838.1 hypothetical protein FHK87_04345 [Aquimarina algicola]